MKLGLATQPSGLRIAIGRAANALGPFLGLVLVLVLFAFLTRENGRFMSASNVKTIANQIAIVGTCGVGMTLIIIGGGIDLSIGSGVALVAVVVALVFEGKLCTQLVETVFRGNAMIAVIAAAVATAVALVAGRRVGASWPRTLLTTIFVWIVAALVFRDSPSGSGFRAVAAGILVGLACGLLNGSLVTATGVVPFIITLGTMEAFRGLAQLLAKGESVSVDTAKLQEHYSWLYHLNYPRPRYGFIDRISEKIPALERALDWLTYAPAVYLMILTGALAAVMLKQVRLGRYFYAIGSNERAAELSGLPAGRIKRWMYGLAGGMVGLAGVMQFSRLTYGSSTAAMGLELDVIAAVVIGGGSLRGGEGSILGTFIGAAIIGFLRNGCSLAGIPNEVQRILVGGIIILAVTLDEMRHRGWRR